MSCVRPATADEYCQHHRLCGSSDPYPDRNRDLQPDGEVPAAEQGEAFRLLRSKLYDMELERRQNGEAEERRSQIRYRRPFREDPYLQLPAGTVTDHRIKLTLYKIDAIMDGDLQELIDSLIAADQAAKLAKMSEN